MQYAVPKYTMPIMSRDFCKIGNSFSLTGKNILSRDIIAITLVLILNKDHSVYSVKKTRDIYFATERIERSRIE